MSTTQRKPNFVFIFCDDLGYGDLACYGSGANRTPQLDRMAEEGALFTDFYVSAPLCSPSRASLMTGCYAQRVGLAMGERFPVLLPGDSIGINPDEVLLPELLKKAGYQTKMIGKWHLGDQPDFLPTRNGFDSFFGLPYSNDMHPEHPLNDRFRFPSLPLMRDEKVVEMDPDQTVLTARYTDEAVRFIRGNHEKPFFLYLAHMYVHLPLYPPDEFRKASQNGDYGAEVECLDWSTGVILGALRESGLAEETLVIFTSDNGAAIRAGGSNLPLRGGKGSTWEGGVREPCLMWWPGSIPAGRRCFELATTMDILPTFSALAGVDTPADRVVDGVDIQALLTGADNTPSPRKNFYYYKGHEFQGIRSGRWKYRIEQLDFRSPATESLFDLAADVGETKDRSADEPAVMETMRKAAEDVRRDLGDGVFKGANCRPAGWVGNARTIPDYMELE